MASPSTPTHRDRFRLRTPPAPLHGSYNDDFEPYSPPRRSSRKTLSNPYASSNTSATSTTNTSFTSTSNIFANKSTSTQTPATPAPKKQAFGLGFAPSDCFSSPPASPALTPADMSKQLLNTPRRADNNKLNNTEAGHDILDPSSSVHKPFMLPTPNKTPTTMTAARKHYRATSLQESARALHFQPEDPNDSMPTRQQSARASKIRRLDFGSEDTRTSNFEIYTESHARVPHLDTSGDNPFYRPRANTVPQVACPSPPLIRKKTAARIQEDSAMEAAAARDEGMIYTFRGRKVFQRYADADGNDADSESDVRETLSQRALKRSAGISAQRPITRSSIKGRLLWAPDPKPLDPYTDEEAETDIEVTVEETQPSKASVPSTPAKTKKTGNVMTPASTARAPRKRNAIDVPAFDEETASVDGAAVTLPTPARSSKKKQKQVNFDFPVYDESAPEPMSAGAEAASVPPPPRFTSKKKKVELNLTPVVEDESEYELVAGTTTPTGGRRRTSGSPFDHWPRTKGGVKRDGEPLPGNASKRTRSATAASMSV